MEEKRSKLLEEESGNERRQYECLKRYDKIVNQFDELMDMMDDIIQTQKRRKVSNPGAKKSTSGAGAIHSDTEFAKKSTCGAGAIHSDTEFADQGDNSKISTPTKAQKTAALEQTLMKHLNDLQFDQP